MNSAEKIQYNNDSISWEEILERFIIKSNNYDHLKTIFKGRNFKEYNGLYMCIDGKGCQGFCSGSEKNKGNPAVCSKGIDCNNYQRACDYINEYNLNTPIEEIIQMDGM